MGTEKRQRQKEGRQARIEAAMAAQKRARTRRTIRNAVIFVIVLVGALFLISTLTNDDDENVATSDATSTTLDATATTTPDTTAGPVITAPPPGESITGDTPCPNADGTSARTTTFEKPPPTCIDPAKTYTAEVVTSKGSFTITLDPATAPQTVNNFVVLSRYHFFDGVPFHRIIPGFVVQGGDANGDPPGSGDPGYSFPDELPTGAAPFYPVGSVAMANSGPNTNGSQFFVVTGDQGVQLPASYSRFGMVTTGMDVVLSIEAVGSEGGAPTEVVTITSVTITES
jgi:cyclophilin family peptidyl-prolyl cis-trans isomerase